MGITVIQARMKWTKPLIDSVLLAMGAATPAVGPLAEDSDPQVALITNVSPIDWETTIAGLDTPDYGGYAEVDLGASTIPATLVPNAEGIVCNPATFQHDGSDTIGSTITGCVITSGADTTSPAWFFNFEEAVPLAEEGDSLQIIPILPLASSQ